jgi:hypothetical protein
MFEFIYNAAWWASAAIQHQQTYTDAHVFHTHAHTDTDYDRSTYTSEIEYTH